MESLKAIHGLMIHRGGFTFSQLGISQPHIEVGHKLADAVRVLPVPLHNKDSRHIMI